jgi:hypothetical protein
VPLTRKQQWQLAGICFAGLAILSAVSRRADVRRIVQRLSHVTR